MPTGFFSPNPPTATPIIDSDGHVIGYTLGGGLGVTIFYAALPPGPLTLAGQAAAGQAAAAQDEIDRQHRDRPALAFPADRTDP